MKITLLGFLILTSIYCKAQQQHPLCDSIYYGDTLRKSFYIEENNSTLVLLYRKDNITIKAPLNEILKRAEMIKLSKREIKNRAKLLKKTSIEKDIADFSFCNLARYLAFEMLYENNCCILVDGTVIEEYREIGFRSTNCLSYSRFVFTHEYDYFLEKSRILD